MIKHRNIIRFVCFTSTFDRVRITNVFKSQSIIRVTVKKTKRLNLVYKYFLSAHGLVDVRAIWLRHLSPH